jgi:hypothetical protein
VACLRDAGLDIAEEVKSKGDLAKVQASFNAWAAHDLLGDGADRDPDRRSRRVALSTAGSWTSCGDLVPRARRMKLAITK